MTTRSSTDAGISEDVRKLKIQKIWNVVPSEFSMLTANPIRKIVDNIKKPENTDKTLIPLSLGDPTVFGNFKCPDVLVESIVRNVRSMKHNGYIHSAGTEAARAAIAQAYGSPEAPLTKEDIVIASGCSGAIDIALTGLLNPGDNILLPKPAFPLYQVICDAHKINVKFYNLIPEKNWEADLAQLESLIDENTKAILVNNPSNPCGSVYTKEHLQQILAVADHHKLPVVADEIYGDMVFGDSMFFPMASLTKSVPVISVGGLAKKFLIPGWRVGWLMVHDRNDILKDVRTAYFKLSQLILGANSLVMSAIPDLLTPTPGTAEEASLEEFKLNYYDTLERNSKFTTDALSKIRGLKVVVPQGAMYVMVEVDTTVLTGIKDDFDFTQKLLDEESVFVLPGQCFGMVNYFRIVFSAPHEVLSDAYTRIAEFCKRHSQTPYPPDLFDNFSSNPDGARTHRQPRLDPPKRLLIHFERHCGRDKRRSGSQDLSTQNQRAPGNASMRLFSSLAALAALCCATWVAPATAESNGVIIVRGNKLYNAKTGERFLIKGMTYEYAVSDKYYTQYSKDAIAQNLKGLQFNALRVYNINPDESYKLFMNDMEALGVYVIIAASPDNSDYFGKYKYATMRKDLPPESKDGETCYPALLLEYGKKIALNFAQYDNTLAMILANEIMQGSLMAGACVKQYAADLKNWMRANSKMMRMIPLAYAAADSSYDNPKLTDTVLQAEEYHTVKIQGLLCGDTMKNGMMQKSIDIYLINEYRWCDDVTYDATYAKFLEMVSGLPIAIGFGEYGCHNTPFSVPRKWPMVPYLYQSPKDTQGFTNVWSGGLAYSYGEAKLDTNSGFPMFTGGSLDPLSTPSSKATTDYTNLKSQFAKYSPYGDPAEWTSSTKCTWAPTVSESISSTNKRATKSGWLISSCTSSDLKIAPTDTWVAKSRQGAPCDDKGNVCEVKVSSALDTTQESLCGGKIPKTSSSSGSSGGGGGGGGGSCSTAADCSSNGQCLKVNGTNECSCLACWTGSDCSVRDTTECTKLSSSKTAPKIVFALVGVFLGVMVVSFIALAIIAAKKKKATDKLADQVKLRGPQARANQEATL